MQETTLETPTSYEPLTDQQLAMIVRSVGSIQAMVLGLKDVNLKAGAGVLQGQKKCIWLRDGRRVTFSIGGGAMVASTTKTADPLADPAARSLPEIGSWWKDRDPRMTRYVSIAGIDSSRVGGPVFVLVSNPDFPNRRPTRVRLERFAESFETTDWRPATPGASS